MSKEKLNYWGNVCEIQKRQRKKGIAKYGQRLEENKDMTICDRLEYLQEELVDGLMYIEHIKKMLSDLEAKVEM